MIREKTSFLLVLSGLFAFSAGATTLPPLSLPELTHRADAVLRVKIKSKEVRWLRRKGPSRIVTFYDASVLERLAGGHGLQEGGKILFALPGGAVGELAQRVHGAPTLHEGAELVVFLGRPVGPGGARGIVGLGAGVWSVDAAGLLHPVLAQPHVPAGTASSPLPLALDGLRGALKRKLEPLP